MSSLSIPNIVVAGLKASVSSEKFDIFEVLENLMEALSSEELEEFLKKNEKVKMWTDEEIEAMIERAEGVSGEEGFVKDYEDKELGTLVEQRPGKSGCIEVRANITIKGRNPEQFFNFLLDTTFSKTYDTMVNKLEILKQLTDKQCICVYESKPIVKWVISGRDFVYVSLRTEIKPGHFVVLSRSFDYDASYPVPKGIVRGWAYHTLFYAKPHPDNEKDTLVIYMASADGKGSIPQWVANWVTRKFAPGYTGRLRTKCLEHEEFLAKNRKEEEEGEGDD